MGLLRWFTKNWANTWEPTHPDLAPLVLRLPVAEAVAVVRRAAESLPRWRVESEAAGELRLTRRTRVFRFVDDVTVRLTPGDAETTLHAESRSRLGKGDLGQNRRNIRELWAAVRSAAGGADR
jgi:uncharacterized protein (DUF1499 family)